jgi:hypothetical protein
MIYFINFLEIIQSNKCFSNLNRMDIYEKRVKYHQFFEDILHMEVDLTYNRIAVVFTAKDQLIHIFDLKPYQNYSFREIKKSGADINKDLTSQHFTIFHFPEEMANVIQEKPLISSNIDNTLDENELEPIISFKKPRCQTRIKAVLSDHIAPIIGLNWIEDTTQSNGINRSNLLFSINSEGYILIYKLKSVYDSKTVININRLTTNPFKDLSEEWAVFNPVKSSKPIIDYYIDYRNLNLITLHFDNFFMFWKIYFVNGTVSVVPKFEVILSKNISYNKVIGNSDNNLLIAFHNQGIDIYKVYEKPPFPKLLSINLNDLIQKKEVKKNILKYEEREKDKDKEKEKKKEKEKEKEKEEEEDPFINYNSYEIFFSDMVDLSFRQIVGDKNYFFSLQKPEFSMKSEYLVIPYYHISNKDYLLLKIDSGKLFSDLKDCLANKTQYKVKNIVYNIIQDSKSPIFFSFSPNYYITNTLKNEIQSLKSSFKPSQIISTYYQPLIVFNEKKVKFYNTRTNLYIFQQEIEHKKDVEDDLIIKWINFNKILISSNSVLFILLQFYNEFDTLGTEVDINKIQEILRIFNTKK